MGCCYPLLLFKSSPFKSSLLKRSLTTLLLQEQEQPQFEQVRQTRNGQVTFDNEVQTFSSFHTFNTIKKNLWHLLNFSDTCWISMTFVTSQCHLSNLSDTCWISMTLVTSQQHLMNLSDTCQISVTFVESQWHLSNLSNTCQISMTPVESQWHLLNLSDTCWI